MMNRDMELIRQLLLKMEAGPVPLVTVPIEDGFSEEQYWYHLYLLEQADFIEGLKVTWDADGYAGVSSGSILITWSGQEFLSAIRGDSVWVALKKHVSDQGLDFRTLGIPLIQQLAQEIVRKALNSPLTG